MSNPIRVLHVSTGFYGGEKTHIQHLSEINASNVQTSIMSPGSRSTQYNLWPHGIWRLFKHIREYSPMLIHCHGLRALIAMSMITLISNHTPPIVYTVHGFHSYWQKKSLKRSVRLILDRLLKRIKSATIVLSQSDYNAALNTKIDKKEHIIKISNGVNISVPNSEPINLDQIQYNQSHHRLFVTVGRLTEIKGVSLIIDTLSAMDQAQRQQIKWIIIGDGPLYSTYKRDIKERQLTDCLYLLGHQDHVCSWLQHCDIYISASKWEGCPYSILEAMSCAKPIIAANVPGCQDLIESGKNGELFKWSDINDFKDTIISAINYSDEWHRYGQENRQKIIDSYSIEKMQNKTYELYKKIIHK